MTIKNYENTLDLYMSQWDTMTPKAKKQARDSLLEMVKVLLKEKK